MRTNVPEAFMMTFDSPGGCYTITFKPVDEWDGCIIVSIAGHSMQWEVIDADRESNGSLVLGGMTTGSETLWNDQFWFELRLDDKPPVVRYWGDSVIWRQDIVA